MKYKINIDPISVKKNPAAGEKYFCEQSFESHTIEISSDINLMEKIKSLYKMYIVSQSFIQPKIFNITIECGESVASHIIGLISKEKNSLYEFRHAINFPINKHRLSSPISSHNFDYLPTMISCEYCKSTFLHTYLKGFQDINETPCEDVCPICESVNCCDLDFQSLQEFLSANPTLC